MTVDAYALQHWEGHSHNSNPWHLLRLCTLLEHGADPRIGERPRLLQGVVQWTGRLPYLEPPVDRGHLTVVDVHGASSPEEHMNRVRGWARSVWKARHGHHAWARGFLAAL